MAQQFGGEVDQGRTAQADRRHVPDDVDPHPILNHDFLDGAAGRPHALGNAGSFKGRPGGGGGGGQLAVGPEHDLAVGPNIDQQGGPGKIDQSGRKDSRHRVAAHEAADHRKHVGPGSRMDVQAKADRRHQERIGRRRDERDFSQGTRVDAQEKLLHRRVAGKSHFIDPFSINLGLGGQLADHLVQCAKEDPLQIVQTLAALGVEDAREHVVAQGRLRVETGGQGFLFAVGQVDEHGGQRGGADVDGHGEGFGLGVAGLEVDQLVVDGHEGAAKAGGP